MDNKIKLLSPDVYNKIAAGEVVERPASIVKELIENSIDAGAKNISVEIYGGGLKKIIVSDNGCGIAAGYVKTAFMPHATSKIDSADDLFRLSSLGFRGEALASIAAISRVTMVTRPKTDELGTKISIKGGFIEYLEESGSPEGTYFTVEELFYNVPARAKFLKSARAEGGAITDIVSRLILSNPEVSIKYCSDGEKIYHSAGGGKHQAMFSVYGGEAAENSIAIQYEGADFKVSGFVGKPGYFKANRTWQTLCVNGRYVINYQISKAVTDIFASYLMKHQYPFYVLYIDIDKSLVDVNVHPGKTEVRFADVYHINNAVKKAVNCAIDADKSIVSVGLQEKPYNTPERYGGSGTDFAKRGGGAESAGPYSFFAAKPGILMESTPILKAIYSAQEPAAAKAAPSGGAAEDHGIEAADDQYAGIGKTVAPLDSRLIGVAFDTYILLERGDSIFLIDQHAAHERILYDKLIAAAQNRRSAKQEMLMPYVFRVNPAETSVIADNAALFSGIGFEIERFGPDSYRILSVPAALCDIDLPKFVNNLLSDTAFFKVKDSDLLKDKLAQAACKAAVKAGDRLDKSEMEYLAALIDGGGVELRCPHGRPIIIKLEKTEIEKWFKRKI